MVETCETGSSRPFRLAVLMACHNRRETTLRCLEALFTQEGLPSEVRVAVFLVDDGSTDGTGDAVRTRFPQVEVIQGDGNLYWAGGMRVAWDAATQFDPDGYLWLNDDTHLYPDALSRFWRCQDHRIGSEPAIWVGSTQDPETGDLTYGGHRRVSRLNRLKTTHISPGSARIRCDTFNGNCVWVSSGVLGRIGFLGKEFRHGAADIDFGFRATKAGIPCWILPGFAGACPLNLRGSSWARAGLSLSERWRLILEPKNLPLSSHVRFVLRHGGWLGPLIAIKPYIDLLIGHFFVWGSKPGRHK